MYLTKWKGYPMKESTWEPLSHFSESLDLINEYREWLQE